MKNNSIRVIKPYKWNGIWVFDDPLTGLEREAFVAGIDVMLDAFTDQIPNAENGFLLRFSDNPFPGHQIELTKTKADDDNVGTYYWSEQLEMEGWLCPALFQYFDTAPDKLFGQVLAIPD